ncbi:nickel ABC transporter permease subunit NikB [Sporosarcina sp. P13]|uniref:nickel ABC transporter permease n=1 Tax=Sporosarcina sp. P13 TaxID=2048263 RepID=UPI000C170A48|nr:nickel ABC transporter permease [Sporosarcina sp. P13]PIC63463.1 nickel ABC transporter permease subunit NikB [Sporosarcina sp. P13]
MIRFIYKRLLGAIPSIFGLSIITFLLIQLIPGNPVLTYLRVSNIQASEEVVQALRVKMGLDQPLIMQYVQWLANVLQFDFGTSFISKRPVVDEMVLHFLPTLQLTTVAFLLIIVCSIPLGVTSALHRGKWFDKLTQLFAFSSVSLPTFWLGFLLMYFFSVQFDLLPVLGKGSVVHFVLPATTLAIGYIGTYLRLIRASTIEVLEEPFILYAQARGLKERTIVWRHILKKAASPTLTGLGMSFGNMLGGTIIVENIFAWPGMGQLLVESIVNQDYPMIQACVLLLGIVFFLTNLLVDILCGWLDPRIRLADDRIK